MYLACCAGVKVATLKPETSTVNVITGCLTLRFLGGGGDRALGLGGGGELGSIVGLGVERGAQLSKRGHETAYHANRHAAGRFTPHQCRLTVSNESASGSPSAEGMVDK